MRRRVNELLGGLPRRLLVYHADRRNRTGWEVPPRRLLPGVCRVIVDDARLGWSRRLAMVKNGCSGAAASAARQPRHSRKPEGLLYGRTRGWSIGR